MTYFITAYMDDKARIIVSESRTTDPAVMVVIVDYLEEQGFDVVVREEA